MTQILKKGVLASCQSVEKSTQSSAAGGVCWCQGSCQKEVGATTTQGPRGPSAAYGRPPTEPASDTASGLAV